MLVRVRAAGLPAAWVTGDTVYGGNGSLRAWLEEKRQPYVLAIAANDGVDLPTGDDTSMHVLPREIAEYALDPHEWRRLSAGTGPRAHDCMTGRACPSSRLPLPALSRRC